MPGSVFWALIFFMMLLTLGLDSSFGGSEAIITALSDEFPIIKRNREIFVACLFSLYFFVGLTSCTQGGFYFFQLLDKFAAGYSILIAVFFEAVAVSWIYGTKRFCADIKDMIGGMKIFLNAKISIKFFNLCDIFSLPRALLDLLLEVCSTTFSPIHYCFWPNKLWAIVIWNVHLPCVGECIGLVHCNLVGIDDSWCGNIQNYNNEGNLYGEITNLDDASKRSNSTECQWCDNGTSTSEINDKYGRWRCLNIFEI